MDKKNKTDNFELSFVEIEKILGFQIDHSFLKYKEELMEYKFRVNRISIKKTLFILKKN